MYYSTHLIAGATVGYLSDDSVIGFVAGTLSHAILDMVPHHDVKKVRYCVGDILTGTLLFIIFMVYWQPGAPIIAGALGGIIPDLEVPLFYFKIIKRRYFPSHSGMVTHRQTGFKAGLLTQVLVLLISLWIIS